MPSSNRRLIPSRKLSPWDLEKLEPGDLIAVEKNYSPGFRHTVLILERTIIEDDYFCKAFWEPGFIIYSLDSKKKFRFSYKFLTTVWKSYFISKGNQSES